MYGAGDEPKTEVKQGALVPMKCLHSLCATGGILQSGCDCGTICTAGLPFLPRCVRLHRPGVRPG